MPGTAAFLATFRPDPAAARSAEATEWTSGSFLLLYVALAVAALVATWLARTYVRFGAGPVRAEGLGVVGLAYLSGGPVRAADAVVLGFLDAGAASLTGDGRIAMRTAWADLPASLEPFRGCGAGLETRRDLHGHLAARLASVRDELGARGLVVAGRTTYAMRAATLAPVGAVLGLGALDGALGASHGESVGFLLTLMVVTLLIALVAFTRTIVRTGAGDRVLADYRARHARAARSPTADEVMLAFALTGEAALPGTAHAGYAALIAPTDGGRASGGLD